MGPARPTILVVDDDATVRGILERRLRREGFTVVGASSAAAALDRLRDGWPSLVVVDIMMPVMDGFELSRRIKQIVDVPIIMLSAVDASEAKVSALELYAEDYVTKPFEPDELVARINRVLRRVGETRSSVVLGEGEVELDLTRRTVQTRRGSQPLTATEARFLGVLAGSLDRVVSIDTLLERVWAESDGPEPSYAWVTVRRLRRKLEEDPDRPRYLLTDRGVGYRLASRPSGATAAAT